MKKCMFLFKFFVVCCSIVVSLPCVAQYGFIKAKPTVNQVKDNSESGLILLKTSFFTRPFKFIDQFDALVMKSKDKSGNPSKDVLMFKKWLEDGPADKILQEAGQLMGDKLTEKQMNEILAVCEHQFHHLKTITERFNAARVKQSILQNVAQTKAQNSQEATSEIKLQVKPEWGRFKYRSYRGCYTGENQDLLYDLQKPLNLKFTEDLYDKAMTGNVDAMIQVGDCYYYGLGITQNISKANEMYNMAMNKGSMEALTILYNLKPGLALLTPKVKEAIEKGYAPLMMSYYSTHFIGGILRGKIQFSIDDIAKLGYAEAIFLAKKNDLKYLREIADVFLPARFELANSYYDRGFAEDANNLIIPISSQLSEQRYANAEYKRFYSHLFESVKNAEMISNESLQSIDRKLDSLYRHSTKDKFNALYKLTKNNGRVTPNMPVFKALQDCDEYKPEKKYQGFSTLKKLANEGNGMAMYELSQCYKNGNRGCPTQDEAKAKEWLQKAADANYGLAQEKYAKSLDDKEEALKYFKLAAANGMDYSKEYVARIEKEAKTEAAKEEFTAQFATILKGKWSFVINDNPKTEHTLTFGQDRKINMTGTFYKETEWKDVFYRVNGHTVKAKTSASYKLDGWWYAEAADIIVFRAPKGFECTGTKVIYPTPVPGWLEEDLRAMGYHSSYGFETWTKMKVISKSPTRIVLQEIEYDKRKFTITKIK